MLGMLGAIICVVPLYEPTTYKELCSFTRDIMDLSNVSTKKLVEELASREAVERIMVEPYEEYSITIGNQKISDSGPVVILKTWD